MKLPLHCAHCSAEAGRWIIATASALVEDGIYETTCARGHKQSVVLDTDRWKLLFDAGCLAFLDGYYREAIGTWTAAIENFYRFFALVVLRAHGVNDATREKFRGDVKPSERRLGAISFAYALEFGAPFPHDFDRRLRNEVVHEGRFASEVEAKKFGEAAFIGLRDSAAALRAKHEGAFDEEGWSQLPEAHRKARARVRSAERPNMRFSTFSVMTLRIGSFASGRAAASMRRCKSGRSSECGGDRFRNSQTPTSLPASSERLDLRPRAYQPATLDCCAR